MRKEAIVRGEKSIAHYNTMVGVTEGFSPDEGLIDLLADLIQYADHAGLSWEDALYSAYLHAEAEMDPAYDEDNPL